MCIIRFGLHVKILDTYFSSSPTSSHFPCRERGTCCDFLASFSRLFQGSRASLYQKPRHLHGPHSPWESSVWVCRGSSWNQKDHLGQQGGVKLGYVRPQSPGWGTERNSWPSPCPSTLISITSPLSRSLHSTWEHAVLWELCKTPRGYLVAKYLSLKNSSSSPSKSRPIQKRCGVGWPCVLMISVEV